MKMIPEKYHAHIEMIVSAARGFLSEGGDLQAMAFLGKFGEGVVPIPVHMGDKDRAAAMVKAICKITRPDYVMMISEAWMVERKESRVENDEYLKSYTGLSDHPDRIDAVFLTLETREGLWFGYSRIKSLGDNARGFDDLQFELTKELEGRFSTFLPREGMTH
jgi:hypothetical protein